jgi:biopolymer transport protein ExbD
VRIPNHLRSGTVGFNMTPMIDIVFLLLIFFLVSSHLAKQESQMKLPLPLAESGRAAVDDRAPRLTINVLDGGELLLAGRRVAADELQQRLAERLAESGRDLEVRIRSARGVPYRQIEPIMLACARAGVWNVTFAVYRAEDAR